MSIFIPNNKEAYSAGYEKGKSDFHQGKGKKGPELFSRVSAIAILSPNLGALVGVDNRKMYIDEWFRGYNKGYEESQSISNAKEIFNNKLNRNKMANNQTSYAYQIELMEGLKSYLDGFQQRLAAVAQNYENKVNSMREANMMEETIESFNDNYVETTKQKILELINLINERDIPFVENQIEYLEQHEDIN